MDDTIGSYCHIFGVISLLQPNENQDRAVCLAESVQSSPPRQCRFVVWLDTTVVESKVRILDYLPQGCELEPFANCLDGSKDTQWPRNQQSFAHPTSARSSQFELGASLDSLYN